MGGHLVILAIDVGNTQTVMGLFDGSALDAHWRLHTNGDLTADEIRVKIAGLLEADGHTWADIDQVIVSSVVPRLTRTYEEIAEQATGRAPMVVGPGLKTGMAIRYDNPHEVGADRIVNGVAAYDRFGGPVIVIDFGTATTLDVVDENGAYLGGSIAPGIETSAEALFSKAARLSKVELDPPTAVIGTNTESSVQSGLLLGQAAMIDGLVERIRDELDAEAPVVATGGLASTMAPLCETIEDVAGDLTLEGLILIYQRNA